MEEKKKVLVFLPPTHVTAEKTVAGLDQDKIDFFVSNQLEEVKTWKHYGSIEVVIVSPFGPKEAFPDLIKDNPLKLMHCLSAGVDAIITPTLVESDVILTNAKGAYSEGLSEFAISCILFFYKNHARLLELKANREWAKEPNRKVAGEYLAIVGYGDIGCSLARMAKHGFRMKVTGVKSNPATVTEEAKAHVDEVVGLDQLDRVLSEADVVVGILPGTPQTFNFFAKERFEKMKETALFMNIGRGSTVNEDDLYDALKEKTIASAALDVFQKEPLSKDFKLFELDNFFYSPHSGDLYATYWQDAVDTGFRTLTAYFNGEELKNVVDKSKGYQC